MFSKTARHRISHAQSPQLRCRSRCSANRGCRGMQETSGRPRGQWVGAHGDITQERDISVCHRRGHLSIEGPSEHPSRLLGPASPGRCVTTISHGSVEPPREGGAGRRHCDRQVVAEHSNRCLLYTSAAAIRYGMGRKVASTGFHPPLNTRPQVIPYTSTIHPTTQSTAPNSSKRLIAMAGHWSLTQARTSVGFRWMSVPTK